MSVSSPTRRQTQGAWAVHVLTASGAVLGFLAIVAVVERRPLAAVVWLVVAQILDGLDGPLARAYGIDQTREKIDGWTLDLVVDFVTCVLAPALILHQFLGFDSVMALLLASAMLLSGALWFSRTDMCTDDHCFRGFPAAWNLVIPTLLLLEPPLIVSAVLVAGLSALSLSNVGFAHPVRVVRFRVVSLLALVCWLAALLLLSLDDTAGSMGLLHALLLASALCSGGINLLSARQRVSLELA